MLCLIGKALEVCILISNVTILFSLELEATEMRALFTYYDMKEFASNVFFISLLKTTYSSLSKAYFIVLASSFIVITAFLLSEDLKLSTCLIISKERLFIVDWLRRSVWCNTILLRYVNASLEVCQSSDLIFVSIFFSYFSGSDKGLRL